MFTSKSQDDKPKPPAKKKPKPKKNPAIAGLQASQPGVQTPDNPLASIMMAASRRGQ